MPDPTWQSEEDKHRAFTKLWLDSQHALGGFVRLQVSNHTDANDIIQEVAAQASFHFDKYDPDRPFAAWLFGIARQRIAEWYRKQNRTPIVFSSDAVEMILPALAALKAEPSDRMQSLRACIQKLNDKQLKLIDLKYSEQLSSEEIASNIGSTASSINVMLFRIRDALRRCVEKNLEAQS